jgi:hypothetical protein
MHVATHIATLVAQDTEPVVISHAVATAMQEKVTRARKAGGGQPDFLSLLAHKPRASHRSPPPGQGPVAALAADSLPEVDFLELVQQIEDPERKQQYHELREDLVLMAGAGEEQIAELWAQFDAGGGNVDDAEDDTTPGTQDGGSASSQAAASSSGLPPTSPALLVPPPPVPPIHEIDSSAAEVDGIGEALEEPPTKKARRVSKWSRRWGLFHMNFREPTDSCKRGAWSTACPVHSKKDDMCTKSLNLTEEFGMMVALQKMTLWANRALEYGSKADHMKLDPKKLPVLPVPDLNRGMLTKEQALAAGFELKG